MRLLLFSDLHCSAEAARRIVELSSAAQVVVGAGDFATMRRGLQRVVGILAQIERPAILVAGNSESFEELVAACRIWPSATVLHGTGCSVEGVPFWGVGGAIPVTPFGSWSYDFCEDDGRRLLAECPPRAVLVSHSPPHGAVDSSRGRHLGSAAVRETIERCQPRLVVCGHIHECAGSRQSIGETLVVNAGSDGMYWDWT